MRNLEETFEYDSQNSLKRARLGPMLTGASVYDNYGRMTAKTANGQIIFYGAEFGTTAKPHAMDAATTIAENFPKAAQTLTYTGFDKVNSTDVLHYILKDNLGSWVTITDANGIAEQQMSFDAWGNRRDPQTWANYTTNDAFEEPMFDRGFTGHEHLYSFGLINMNGRMYDPVMSSFLSADRYVQNPWSAQGFNRYAYCMYNPLRLTDPTGWLAGGGGGHGYTPNSADYGMDPYAYADSRGWEPRDFCNANSMFNLAFYDNIRSNGGGTTGGYFGTYGYQVTHCSNSVYNFYTLAAMLALIQNWQNSPSYTTNKEMCEAGITNMTAGESYGGDGYRNSYYTWTDSNGNTHTASALNEHVGGNKNGAFAVSNQPLCMYGIGSNITNMAINRAMITNGYINSGNTIIGKGAEWAKLTINGTKVSQKAEAAVVLSKISKGSKILGVVGLTINLGCTYVQVNNGYIPWQEGVVRFGMSVAELGLAQIPYVGPILSIGVTAFDIGGGFDDNLYNTENWWK